MTRKFKAVIFDWSGTLSDEFETIHYTISKVFEGFGKKPLGKKELYERMELPFERFYKKHGIEDDTERAMQFKKAYAEAPARPKPFPETKPVLEWLKKKGIVIAVLSAHRKEFLMQEAEEYGVLGLIDKVVANASDKRHAIIKLLNSLGSGRDETLFVGDMVHDVETARHAGIPVAVVLHGYDNEEKLRAAKPDYVIKTIGELKQLGLF